jgi:hypothetical protein
VYGSGWQPTTTKEKINTKNKTNLSQILGIGLLLFLLSVGIILGGFDAGM